MKVGPVCFVLWVYLIQCAWASPGRGADQRMRGSAQDLGCWNCPAGISCPLRADLPALWAWVRRSSASAVYVTSNGEVPASSRIPFAVTWMTGYSGQEKIALTSCDSGKVNHIGTWPLNTQGAGSNLRGWRGAPLSSLGISWLLSWTSRPSFPDKLCLKEWWAVCH